MSKSFNINRNCSDSKGTIVAQSTVSITLYQDLVWPPFAAPPWHGHALIPDNFYTSLKPIKNMKVWSLCSHMLNTGCIFL